VTFDLTHSLSISHSPDVRLSVMQWMTSCVGQCDRNRAGSCCVRIRRPCSLLLLLLLVMMMTLS